MKVLSSSGELAAFERIELDDAGRSLNDLFETTRRSIGVDARHASGGRSVMSPDDTTARTKSSALTLVEAAEGSHIRFLVPPRSGRTGVVRERNPDNEEQWIVEVDGAVLTVANRKIAALGASIEGKMAQVIAADDDEDDDDEAADQPPLAAATSTPLPPAPPAPSSDGARAGIKSRLKKKKDKPAPIPPLASPHG